MRGFSAPMRQDTGSPTPIVLSAENQGSKDFADEQDSLRPHPALFGRGNGWLVAIGVVTISALGTVDRGRA
jgi:hypothetical protein